MNVSTSKYLAHLSKITVAAVALFFVAACGEDTTELETPATCSQELQLCEAQVFLEVNQLEFLRQNGAVVLDTRDEDVYVNGHIPGSLNASWQVFRDPELNGILWDDEAKLQQAARDLGINNDDTIIVLGQGDGSGGDARAGRLFWTLEYLGHDNVYLVNGGFDAWLEAGYDGLEAGTTDVAEGDFTIDLRPERRATRAEVEAAIEEGTIRLVDTRTIDEWIGEELRNNPEGGHIPEAIHYHWEDVMEDGKLRPREDILAEFEELGIVPGTLTIPYCQSGVRSGFFYAVLKWLDYPEPKNYDGSWWEWSRAFEDGEVAIIVPE